jgi:hypothetical protein
MKETILARGHENVLATHKTTLEITKEANLSKRGNCVIAVSADKAINDLRFEFKEGLRKHDARVAILIEAEGVAETVNAFGDSKLILDHPTDIVVRKSSHISNRTLAIEADKAACDLSRKLVEKLRSPGKRVKITIALKAQ